MYSFVLFFARPFRPCHVRSPNGKYLYHNDPFLTLYEW
jgi:hypothetical protein